MFKFTHVRQNVARWLMVLALALALAGPLAAPSPIFADGGGCASSSIPNCGG